MKSSRAIIASLAWGLTVPLVAEAGPWPRAEGSVFAAFSYEVVTSRAALRAQGMADDPSPDVNGFASLYAEFGLTDRVTVILDVGGDERRLTAQVEQQLDAQARRTGATDAQIEAGDAFDSDPAETWDGAVSLQYAFGVPNAPNQYAARIGFGVRSYEEPGPFFGREKMTEEALIRVGASYGRGFVSPVGPGWLALDFSGEFRTVTPGGPVKLDATLGVRPRERLAYLLELQSGDFPNADPYVRALPGAALTVRDGVTVQTSLIYGLEGPDEVGVKVGLWIEF